MSEKNKNNGHILRSFCESALLPLIQTPSEVIRKCKSKHKSPHTERNATFGATPCLNRDSGGLVCYLRAARTESYFSICCTVTAAGKNKTALFISRFGCDMCQNWSGARTEASALEIKK